MDLFTRAREAGPEEVLIQLHPSPVRRSLGLGGLAILSAMCLSGGLSGAAESGIRWLPLLLGILGFYLLYHFWRSSAKGLELTPSELREIGGRRVIAFADIQSVNRELFGIIKPTNGFVIVNRGQYPNAFSAGIWWRFGSRIGIGGLTPAGEGKAMAELLEEMIKDRDNPA